MKRIVVLGGSGFFGELIVDRLRAAGLEPIVAARTRGDLRIDANNPDDIKNNLKQRDLVIDAAGPFQNRTPALIDTAMRMGFDIIDLSDSAEYTAMIYEREAPIGAAGIRVLTACSVLSAVSGVILKQAMIEKPRKLSVYLRPASRYTANAAAVESFLRSIVGSDRRGLKVRSVDAVTLPRVFPTLTQVEFIVDTGHTSGNFLLQFEWFRRLLMRYRTNAANMARRIGTKRGILRYEVSSTLRHKQLSFTGERTFMLAVFPAIQAATAISAGRFPHRGLVPPTEHVDAAQLFDAARSEGMTVSLT